MGAPGMPTVQAPPRGPSLGTSIRQNIDPKRPRSASRELRGHLVIRDGCLELLLGIGEHALLVDAAR